MTTWQDQQPMSRRALRESERAHAQAVMSDTGEVESQESAPDQQIWSQNLTAEPLGYATEARQPRPDSDTPLRRPRASAPANPAAESPGYRLRDFGPESRGSSFSSTQPAPWTPPSAGSEDLNYHTSVEANRPVPEAYSAPTPTPPIVVTPADVPAASAEAPVTPQSPPGEHTITRRELREMRNAAAAQAPVETPVPAQLPEGLKPAQSAELTEAMSEFDRMLKASQIPPLVEPPAPSPPPAATAPPAAVPEYPAPAASMPERPAPAASAAAPTAVPESAAPAPTAVPQPPASVSAPPPEVAQRPAPPVADSPAIAGPESPAEPLREVVSAPEVYAAPAGHWSSQVDIDEQYQKARGPHKRDLSSSDAITTSALVLPSFPSTGPITGPVSGTGQVLMTGSIDLPRSLGINGLHPSRYDRADIDSIIDAGDREDSAPDSAPVRAVRAVSTYTSSQGIIQTKRPRGNNLPMVLSITAGVMMIGVVVLVVAGMIFKIF